MEEIVNRVANSPLVTIDMEKMFDFDGMAEFDMKEHLFQGLILKEKDFREFVKDHDWSQYKDKKVAVFCSADAIVPTWAYMLVANRLQPFAADIYFGTEEELIQAAYQRIISEMDMSEYEDKMVVVKGCSDKPVPIGAYVEITRQLTPRVKSLMFGEPCSTVPIYKRKK